MDVKRTNTVLLLDTAVCDTTFEFQGTGRAITIVRHDGVVAGTDGPVRPTTSFGNTPGRRENPPGRFAVGLTER